MKEFRIKIIETLEKEVVVNAENEKEAFLKVDCNYRMGKDDYVLDSENYVNTEFKVINDD